MSLTIRFGKYKGWKVDDVFAEDQEYCDWFLNNIDGNEEIKKELLGLFEDLTKGTVDEYGKLSKEILLGLEKNGRSKAEAEMILGKFVKKVVNLKIG